MSEPTFTMDEARRQLALEDCNNYGHDWDITLMFGGEPVRILCIRCGWGGHVKMSERGVAGGE